MSDDITRVTCVAENCGTFPMDDALYRKLKRTGETFTCPSGHEQHFTESVEQKLRDRISDLKQSLQQKDRRIQSLEEEEDDLVDEILEYRRKADHLESLLLDSVSGVVEVAEDEWKWSCDCGSRGKKAFDTPEEARERLQNHVQRTDCDGPSEEVTLDA